jgi:hypothetical protein
MESEELRKLREDLEAASKSATDDAMFHELVERSLRLLMLPDLDFAKLVGTNRSSINRWKNGKNAPHPAVRPRVYALLLKRTRLVLNSEARPARASIPPATGRTSSPAAPSPT